MAMLVKDQPKTNIEPTRHGDSQCKAVLFSWGIILLSLNKEGLIINNGKHVIIIFKREKERKRNSHKYALNYISILCSILLHFGQSLLVNIIGCRELLEVYLESKKTL